MKKLLFIALLGLSFAGNAQTQTDLCAKKVSESMTSVMTLSSEEANQVYDLVSKRNKDKKALKEKIPVRGYISCVSHCPYEGQVNPQKVAEIAKHLIEMGCYEVSLGDTTGKGSPDVTSGVLEECLKVLTSDKLAGHFHDTYQNALNNIQLCLEKGIKTFDASVGGLGGCPYSPGAKGNVATEKVNKLLISLGYRTNLNAQKIDECSEMALKLKMGKNYD